jgi:hypothetical protein
MPRSHDNIMFTLSVTDDERCAAGSSSAKENNRHHPGLGVPIKRIVFIVYVDRSARGKRLCYYAKILPLIVENKLRQFPLSRRRVHTVLNRSAWLFRIRIVVRCSTSPTQVLLLLLVGRSSGAIPSPFDVAIQDGAQTDRQEEQEE